MKLCKDCAHYQVEPQREANGLYGDGQYSPIRVDYFCLRHPSKIDLVTGEQVTERKRCYSERSPDQSTDKCNKEGQFWSSRDVQE